ncbi:MAG: hypothetical protein LIP01_06785 [Tannerellaceae bacterium]|nr:hypothetical protein [Tannerellaceae bacterium]
MYPYIDRPYDVPEDMYIPRTPSAEIYKTIEADLLDIIKENALPNVAFYDNGGYATRAMAQTLLAQIYLQWAGAPLNGGTEYYTKAAEMAINVVEGGQHELIQRDGSSDDIESAFNVIKTTKSSNEIIFAQEFDQSSYGKGNSYAVRSIESGATQWGILNREEMCYTMPIFPVTC